ncbi:MAG: site-specific DNA-methyltransferase [Candidatus Electrothrix sp. AR5]|nr:site-specific DNA-methyltransferase [Candidatus Electrothrix sp. AR5]
MASGEMSEAEFIDFLTQSFQILAEFSKNGSIHYICMDWRHIYEIITAGKTVYDEFKNLCVWNKDNGGMGTFYRSKHELVFVFKHGNAKHINNFCLGETGRYRTNIWDYLAANSFANESREKYQTQSGRFVAGQSEEIKMHPTAKPVAMVSDAILDCSNEGDVILDTYLGSGTTLISAHKTGRIGYGSEISPAYVDTAIIRFMKLTGQKVINADTGEEFQYNQ